MSRDLNPPAWRLVRRRRKDTYIYKPSTEMETI